MDITASEAAKQIRVTIFFCYAREDEQLLNQLKNHLQPLQRQGLITIWYDREIRAGSEWEPEIKRQLNTAQIILLLVSPDFMASDYCYSVEMERALQRHQRGEATVIPIILRDTYWHGEPLGRLQALPTDGKPVTSRVWGSQDEAFYTIVLGIRDAVEAILATEKEKLSPPPEATPLRETEEQTPPVEDSPLQEHTQIPVAAFIVSPSAEQAPPQPNVPPVPQALSMPPTAQTETPGTISSQTAASAHESTPQRTGKQPGYERNAIRNLQLLLENPNVLELFESLRFSQFPTSHTGEGLKALRNYEERLAADPGNNVLELFESLLPSQFPTSHTGEGLKALRNYEERLAANPGNVEVLSQKGDVLYGLKRYQEALAVYEEVIRLDSNNVPTYSQKGDVLFALKSYDEALTAYEEALRLDPTYLAAYTGKGDVLHSLKRNEEALAAYEKAITFGSRSEYWGFSDKRDPYIRAYGGKGKVLCELKRFSEAFAAYATVKRLDHFNHTYDREIENAGELIKKEAIAAAEEAVRQNPGDASAHYNKGIALFFQLQNPDWGNERRRLQDYREALAAFEQAIQLDPHFAAACYQRAFVLLRLAQSHDRDNEEALAAYREAESLDPHPTYLNKRDRFSLNALEQLEEMVTHKREKQEELTATEQAIAQNPNDAQAYCRKGKAHSDLGQYGEALEAYDRALGLNSKLLAALVAKGDILRKIGPNNDAIVVYDEALKLDPSNVDALFGKGESLLTLKQNKEALALFDKCIRLKPGLAIAYHRRSLALRRLKQTREADAALKTAKNLGWVGDR